MELATYVDSSSTEARMSTVPTSPAGADVEDRRRHSLNQMRPSRRVASENVIRLPLRRSGGRCCSVAIAAVSTKQLLAGERGHVTQAASHTESTTARIGRTNRASGTWRATASHVGRLTERHAACPRCDGCNPVPPARPAASPLGCGQLRHGRHCSKYSQMIR